MIPIHLCRQVLFPTTSNAYQPALAFNGLNNHDVLHHEAQPDLAFSFPFRTGFTSVGLPMISAFGIAIDAERDVYVVGTTLSSYFPIYTLALSRLLMLATLTCSWRKLKNMPGRSFIAHLCYLPGWLRRGGLCRVGGIAVDSLGNTSVTSHTVSTDFPTLNAFQSTNAGPSSVTPSSQS